MATSESIPADVCKEKLKCNLDWSAVSQVDWTQSSFDKKWIPPWIGHQSVVGLQVI